MNENYHMKIGILREGKIPHDKRVPLSPLQCSKIKNKYSDVEIFVQTSNHRCYSDKEYINYGVKVVDNLKNCDVLLGIKEVPKSELIPEKTYLFFSHTIKSQPYNRMLLKEMVNKNIRMIDYEVLKNNRGSRIIGFGRYAGIIGCYNGFLTYGKRTKDYFLKPAFKCNNRKELEKELRNVKLSNIKIILTGKGRVGKGALEIINFLGINEVNKQDFLLNKYKEPVFVHLDYNDYNVKSDGSKFDSVDFFNNPNLYKSIFNLFASHADIFIAGHYFKSGSPNFFTKNDAKSKDFKIKTIADISCDINGPIPSTIRSSTIEDPIYGYNPKTEKEDVFDKKDVISVMAVDNLPCELPKDSSEDFGCELIKHVLPLLIEKDDFNIIKRATICENGKLTSHFNYLESFLNGG